MALFAALIGVPAAAQPAQDPAPPPKAAATESIWSSEGLTGDWGGARTDMRNKGVDLELTLHQFYQGVASGGVDESSEYFGTFKAGFKSDLGKMAGWDFWTVDFSTETRYGGPLPLGTGSINPVNTSALVPKADGEVFAITALNVTRLFPIDLKTGELMAVGFGRYNLLDLIDEDFFAGAGTERFFNMAQIGPLTVLREVPLITNAISYAWIKRGEPFFTFVLLDPNDHSTTTGLSSLFADGVTFSPALNLGRKYFGKSAKHTVTGAITTKKYTPFDAIRQVIIPGPPLFPIDPERGSWSLSYTFRQYLVERGHRDGWGFFAQASLANENTSPITVFFDVGLGGNGLFATRQRDEFGIAYAYTDVSDELRDNIDLATDAQLRAEHQLEIFYNAHLTPWFRLTGDLQIIRPTRPIADTAIVPGIRLGIVF